MAHKSNHRNIISLSGFTILFIMGFHVLMLCIVIPNWSTIKVIKREGYERNDHAFVCEGSGI